MHIGIFGMGYWGKNILRNLLVFEDIQRITICDPLIIHSDYEQLFSGSRIRCTTNQSEILQDPTIEAVFIVTPSETHFQIASNALQSGKHVFVEKPVTTSTEDLEELIILAEENRRVLFPSHTYLHTNEIEKLKSMIDDDDLLGKPFIYQSNRSNFGRFRSDKNVVWDLAIHDLYIVKYIFSQHPISVSATGLKYNNEYPEVMSNISINYDGGLSVSIIVNWTSPKKFRDIIIVGSKGSFFYDDCLVDNKITYYYAEIPDDLSKADYSNTKNIVTVKKVEAISEQIRSFFSKIINKDVKNDAARFTLEIIKTLEAIDISIRDNGKPYFF